MKSISRSLALIIMMFALTAYVVAAGIQTPPPAAGAPQAEKSFQGQLVSVDAKAHTLIAKGADNKEMTFTYKEDTPVMGGEKSVEGLAGKTGAKVTINYRVEGGANLATRIALSE